MSSQSVWPFLILRQKRDKRVIEIKYFENTEESSGLLKDSKKVVLKGQVFVDGMPIGGQFTVAETVISKFDHEKLAKFRDEVLKPIASAGFRVASLAVGVPAQAGDVMKLLKLTGNGKN